MKIRPGRTRSLIAGVAVLIVMVAGLFMMSGFGGPGLGGGVPAFFTVLWIGFGLLAAGAAFYNAFSKEGLPLYEVDMSSDANEEEEAEGTAFCPQCGRLVDPADRFCRHCGAPLQ